MKKLKEIKIKIYFVENGTIQASKQEEKAGKVQEADKMGSFLDSAKNLRQDSKSPPRQAHEAEEALEKKEEQGVKMAKKEESSKIVLERTYVIPLRRETLKVPPFKKANKAAKAVREFISKHMKSENVAIGRYLNLYIWRHGAKNPPHKVKVNTAKDDKGKVFVELFGAPREIKAEEKKKGAKKEEKIIKEAEFAEKPGEKLEKEIEETKEEKAEEAKKIEKEEIKELQKEHPKHHAPKAPPKPKLQEAHPTAPKSV